MSLSTLNQVSLGIPPIVRPANSSLSRVSRVRMMKRPEHPGLPIRTSSYLNHPRYLNVDPPRMEFESFFTYMFGTHDPMIDSCQLPFQNSKTTLLPKVHRHHIKTIISFLCDLHKMGLSLRTFNESNIVFQKGELRFRGLDFVLRLEAEDRARDFRILHDLIESLIIKYKRSEYEIPGTINDLLATIKYCGNCEVVDRVNVEDMLLNHLGIQSHETVLDYIKRFHDELSYMRASEERDSYYNAVEEMHKREEYSEDWTEKLIDGSAPFNFLFGRRNGTYVGEGEARVVNRDILRFCRNAAHHLPQHMKKYTSNISSKEVELTIMAYFDMELLSFQKLTHKHNIAHHFFPGFENNTSDFPVFHSTPNIKPSSPTNELESLKTYMSSVGDPIIELFEVPSKNTDNKLKCSYVPNVHRAIIKTIVEFFCDLSKMRQSVDSLKEENIFYNKVERILEFHVHKNVELLDESDRAQHFKLLHDVIKNLFGNHRIPLPIWDLLLTLRYYRTFENSYEARIEDILPNHLGIQSHDTVLNYIRNFHERRKFLPGDKDYNLATNEIHRRNKDWMKCFTDADNSRLGPLLDCLNYEINGKKFAYNGRVNRHILVLCRHCVVHLPEHMKKYTDSGCDSKDIELIIMVLFYKELLSFQKQTYKHKIAHFFIPDYLLSVFAGRKWRMQILKVMRTSIQNYKN